MPIPQYHEQRNPAMGRYRYKLLAKKIDSDGSVLHSLEEFSPRCQKRTLLMPSDHSVKDTQRVEAKRTFRPETGDYLVEYKEVDADTIDLEIDHVVEALSAVSFVTSSHLTTSITCSSISYKEKEFSDAYPLKPADITISSAPFMYD